ncbi:hypothetical protein U0070_016145 [Myodes glareolus]|uniref:Uncharacterized protein n=1 Tax=Myodes glareolus TaxID=447135 RepID=A0AAW0IDL7_MYOGA
MPEALFPVPRWSPFSSNFLEPIVFYLMAICPGKVIPSVPCLAWYGASKAFCKVSAGLYPGAMSLGPAAELLGRYWDPGHRSASQFTSMSFISSGPLENPTAVLQSEPAARLGCE